jgi:phage tail protein X
MSEFLVHTATDGDRWDALAAEYYGDPLNLGPLLRANPALASLPSLPAGARVSVPVIPRGEARSPARPPVAWR